MESPLHFYPALADGAALAAPCPVPAASWRERLARALAGVGLWLRRHRGWVMATQWSVVLFYGALVVVPAFVPATASDAHIWNDLRLFAAFIFWGLWWPGVMVATVSLGRVWCGLFCPEGFLSELASRRGLGLGVPRWLKWPGWPFVAFVTTTVYGQLISVYEYAEAALLILGGSTLAAIVVGFTFGRGKRVWCHYLCPASGVFAVLAKIAPLHYRVDRAAWDRAAPERFDCPPLVDVRRMTSASDCHSCARCAGQRDAVRLAARTPFAEALSPAAKPRHRDALTLLFGVLGIATMAFQWTVSPWCLQLKLALADWLVEHDLLALLGDGAPWWLLTHYPQNNDVFTWLDGLVVLAYTVGGGMALGALLAVGPLVAAALVRASSPLADWRRFAFALVPLAAASVVLGLTMTTATQLRGEHLLLPWLPAARATLLTAGGIGSLWLAFELVRRCGASILRRLAAFLALCLPVVTMSAMWALAFFVW
ncbi:MAG: 4Fe-4S binding protein [Azoarcus sp.]|nr:4Fe-4S binding protein [Azoarcus sp.]